MKNEQRIVEWKLSPQVIEESEAEVARILEDMRAGRISATTPSPLMGAHRFHKWATSRLAREVREHYGEHLVLATHRLLADGPEFPWARRQANDRGILFLVSSMRDGRFPAKPDLSDKLRCPECSCKSDDGNRADCLIRRFHEAFEKVTSKSIAKWYFGLDGQAEKDVRAFLRAAAPSDPLIRDALDRILTREVRHREGLRVKVEIEKRGRRKLVALRDAFMLTAMVAAHEWTGIKLLDETNRTRKNKDCAARVADRFGVVGKYGTKKDAETVRNQWKRLRTRAVVSEDLAAPRHRGWALQELWRIGIEVMEDDPVRAASLERLAKRYGGTVDNTR